MPVVMLMCSNSYAMLFVAAVATLLLTGAGQSPSTQAIHNNQGIAINALGDVDVIIHNLKESADYKDLITELDGYQRDLEQSQQDLQANPDSEVDQQLYQRALTKVKETEQKLNKLVTGVQQLAWQFQANPPSTPRLKAAYAHFVQGDYEQARLTLDVGIEIDQQNLLQQQTQNQQARATLAADFILSAELAALDLGDKQRIQKAMQLFEQALDTERSASNLLRYAQFLEKAQQIDIAIQYYEDALFAYQQLPIPKQLIAVIQQRLATLQQPSS